ncbi:MAG: Hsp20/alpha crystallin family protein [Verrucomicrobia bacterium]|nr:Hsp20/alpha crystallin family protein [Verrucomicrobiota bacterium]
MTLTRWTKPEVTGWSPFWHLSTLRDEIDRLFETPLAEFTRGTQQFLGGWLPAVDLYEDKDSVVVKAELPGMKKEDIEISLHDGVLTLAGERKQEQKFKDAELYRTERFLGRFQRTLSLPSPVESDKVSATYKDGILTVTLPKTEEAKPKQIEVRVN